MLVSSTPLSIEYQTGFFLLGKPKKESLKEDYRDTLNTFFECRGLPLLSDTAKVDIYLRLKMKNQTVTSTLYDRAKKTCSYTVGYCDSSGKTQLGDVCCYVHCQDKFVAIMDQFRIVPGCIINYKDLNLVKHISRVVCSNTFTVVQLEQLKQICLKVEMCGRNDVYVSRFPNLVERNLYTLKMDQEQFRLYEQTGTCIEVF